MRMRKKKYLDERLEQCTDYLFVMRCDDRNYLTSIKEKEYIDLAALFGNDNPVVLEVGCGKGRFACELAKANPNVNVLALEKSKNVIVMACESARNENIPNVRFLHGGAEYLEKFLRPASVERIYLNFSCPFPKNSYANHRLTNERFLKSYAVLLKPGAEIHQKTDNMHFFEYSVEQLTHFGFALKNVSLDLHNSGFDGNIETEYEHRFASQGFPIYRLEAYLK
ncbi:MAG TPA: tRNA (guanosine(46)-N7)-methyltransferase TrmB [Ruminococcaceae bacterium]|nr:tRNA (guanosine(46)-N7)-methyltransferase TrmB [Oscillospiraceae bacterium]